MRAAAKTETTLIIFFALIIIMSISCTKSEPVISYGFLQIVLYQEETQPREYLSFFILAEDDDGFENLDELYLYHDREQLRWRIKSDEWIHYNHEGKDWIGTRSVATVAGTIPRGVYRALLVNKGGESAQRNFTYDGAARYPFPEITVSEGEYTINSQWPVNRFIIYDSSGNYINTVFIESLSGSFSQLSLPSQARTAALWAEDEENHYSAYTNVVPVN